MRRVIVAFLILAAGSPASAHGAITSAGHAWVPDPWILSALLLGAASYLSGAIRLWRRAAGGRGLRRRDAILFAAGWLVLAGAVASPLHQAGEQSFTMHMIEHELIMLAASPLLVASRPAAVMLWSLPQSARRLLGGGMHRPSWRFLTDPVVATALQAVAMWAWHAPALFDRALDHQGWHVAQHASFLVTSLLFWWAMAHPPAGRQGYGLSALCLFATSLVGGLLGALMAFSNSPWYAGYAAMGMTPYGLSPAEDQQLAGLLMWIPGGLVHAGAALYFAHRWMNEARNVVAVR